MSRKLKQLDPEISARGGTPGRVTASVKVSTYLLCSGNCQEAGGLQRSRGQGVTSEKCPGPDPLQAFVRILLCSKWDLELKDDII